MRLLLVLFLFALSACSEPPASMQQRAPASTAPTTPYLMVLGIGQDGGAPQAGSHLDPRWIDRDYAQDATSLGLVDPESGQRWMFEATPDFRRQWYALDTQAGLREKRVPDGIFLTHAHIGHYTGLMFLGHESIGAQGVPVFAFPRMATFLTENGPWSQLVKYGNIVLSQLESEQAVTLTEQLSVTPFLVPHRQEFSEVAGFIINGPNKRVGFIPDIDSWEEWDSTGMGLDAFLNAVDLAYIDATFYADGEIPGRDMSGFPHPFITHTISRLSEASAETKAKIVFIHLNHTNPALYPDSPEVQSIQSAGFRVATPGEIVEL
jgi:pyrroloquinoline quinone biosynthesis protein B